MTELILTNGDSAAELLAAAGLRGRIVPWRDVLHEGPLKPGMSLEQQSDVRSEYLAARFGLPYADVRADMLARDAILRNHHIFERITIWLEHDLYDQLQLLQILAFFDRERRIDGLVLVQADDFLGAQRPESILRFAERAVPVTRAMVDTAGRFWAALTEPTPPPLVRAMGTLPTEAFPFLWLALERMLAELPAPGTGLSRSERTLLAALADAPATPRQLFTALLASEEAAFMGDWSAFRILDDFNAAPQPLVGGLPGPYPCTGAEAAIERYVTATVAITPLGRRVLASEIDAIATNGIDRWWGGTHLAGKDCWRWDAGARRLVPPAA
ncbi:MAG: DUF1835 domain-containing protein [Bauldia sp.]|nr:DUF1835 domain-containing protein [Bauldia sp.]